MALDGIATEVLNSVKDILREKIVELIPSLMKEVTPELVSLAKASIENYIIDNNLLSTSVKDSLLQIDQEIDTFTKNFADVINGHLNRRDDVCWKYTRCVRLLDLYNECMLEEAMYIPKKFRKDKYHFMSKEELHILNKMELKEFQLECEILTCRKEEFYKRCVDIDKEVEDLINQSNMSTKATQSRLKRWQDLVQDDITATNKKWDEKIAFMKSAFEKDKVSLKQHQQNRIKDSKSEMPRNPAPNDEQIPLPQRQRTKKQTDTSENVSNNVPTTEERNNSTWISRLQKNDSKKVSSVSSASVPNDLKGRPVVAGTEAPTQHLSELLEKILSPLVVNLESYIKDDWDFLRKFPRQLEPDCQLYSCDVVSCILILAMI